MQAHSCGESLRLLLCKKEKVFQREILAACFILVALYAQSLKIPFCKDWPGIEASQDANNGDSRFSASAAFAVCCAHLLGTAR